MRHKNAVRFGAAIVCASAAHAAMVVYIADGTPPEAKIAGGAISVSFGASDSSLAESEPSDDRGRVPAPAQSLSPEAPDEAVEEHVLAPSTAAPEPVPVPPPEPELAPTPDPVEPIEPSETATSKHDALQPAPTEVEPSRQVEERSDSNEGHPEPTPADDTVADAGRSETAQERTRDSEPPVHDRGGDADPDAGPTGVHDSEIAEPDQTGNSAGNAAYTNFARELMQHLSRRRRPRASGPGSSHVTFSLDSEGRVRTIEISRSSGSARFDRDAVKFVDRASPFPAPPPGVSRTFTVEIKGR